jgi:hypothetical protein
MQVLQTKDGFLWADVTSIAESLWLRQDLELYAIYDNQSEHLIETQNDFDESIRLKDIIVIELCPIQEIKQLN